MRGPALSAVPVALLGVLLAGGAQGHLRASGTSSLVRMMRAADGMLHGRAAEATRDARRSGAGAQTRFAVLERVAGDTPSGSFVLASPPPVLRYGAGQTAVMLVARAGGGAPGWVSVQPAGTAILLPTDQAARASLAVLRDLWRAIHREDGREPDATAAARALARALRLPAPKLRALAFLDLSVLAGDPEHLPADVIAMLEAYGSAPGDDPALAPRVHDLARVVRDRQRGAQVARRDGKERP